MIIYRNGRKRYLYANAKMEGLNITFPQTKTILEGINVPNLKIDIDTF